jgi:ketosteroid isomerase-like protein
MNLELEQEIRTYESRLYTAMSTSDVAELDTLIADDLIFISSTGQLATKEMDLELHRTGATTFHELVPKELEIRIWSDRFVFITAKIFLRVTFLGEDFAGDYRYTRVWRHGNQGWQIAGGSVSQIR